jgi:hypothetical protein
VFVDVQPARTTDLLERLFVEERRRPKIIPDTFGERPVLKLMFGSAKRWCAVKFTTSNADRSQPSGRTSTKHQVQVDNPANPWLGTVRPTFPAALGLESRAVRLFLLPDHSRPWHGRRFQAPSAGVEYATAYLVGQGDVLPRLSLCAYKSN